MSPWAYINQIFTAKEAKTGGIVRRQISDVKKYATPKALLDEVKSRGFHLVETGDQFIVICNPGALKIHC